MLDQIIRDLIASPAPARVRLQHGATLDWQPATRTLTAERLNRRMDDKEAATFERFIRVAGFDHTRRVRTMRDADAKGLNTWEGVAWVVTAAKPNKAEAQAELQDSLFTFGE